MGSSLLTVLAALLFFMTGVCTTDAAFKVATKLLGCFSQKSESRELKGFAATANMAEMTPTLCRDECRSMKYLFAGLNNGSLCFCGKVRPAVTAGNVCKSPCTGNNATMCGGPKGFNVYSVLPPLTDITPVFHVGGKISTELQEWTVNTLTLNLASKQTVKFNSFYVDGRGPSGYVATTAKMTFIGGGKQFLGINVVDAEEKNYQVTQTVQVVTALQSSDIELTCPPAVNISSKFDCDVIIRQGENMEVTINFEEGKSASIQDADTFVEVIKPKRGQSNGTVTKIASNLHTFFWNDVFRQNATLKGFDVKGNGVRSAGNIYIFRPDCKSQNKGKFCMRSYSCIPLTADCSKETDRWALRCNAAAKESYDLLQRKCLDQNGIVEKYPFTAASLLSIKNYLKLKTIRANTLAGGSFIPANVHVEVGDMFLIDRPQYYNQIQRWPGEVMTAKVQMNSGTTAVTVAKLSLPVKIESSFPEVYPVLVRPFRARFQHTYFTGDTNETVVVNVTSATNKTPFTNNMTISVLEPITNMTFECPEAAAVKVPTTCNIPPHPGSDVLYDWYFDTDKDLKQTDNKHNLTFGQVGIVNVTLVGYNSVSKMTKTKWIIIQEVVAGLAVALAKPATEFPQETSLSWTKKAGTNVSYEINLGDETIVNRTYDSGMEAPELTKYTHAYKEAGNFSLTLNASNLVSHQVVTVYVPVQKKIAGLAFKTPLAMAKGKDGILGFVTTEGTSLEFAVKYGTHSPSKFPVNCIEPFRACTFTAPPSIFKEAKNYSITLNGKNMISTMTTAASDVIVDEEIEGLKLAFDREYVAVGKDSKITATVISGTSVWITAKYADDKSDSAYIAKFTSAHVFTHQYKTEGNYNVVVRAENLLGSLTKTIAINVQYPVENVVMETTSPGSLLEIGDSVNVKTSLILEAGKPIPTKAKYKFVFSAEDQEAGDLDFTENVREIKTMRTYRVHGDNPISCNVSNEVSFKVFPAVIVIDEKVLGLKLEINETAIVVDDVVTFTMSMTWGSRVSISIDYKDGSPVKKMSLDRKQPLNITHQYKTVGIFNVTLTAVNAIGPTVATLAYPLVVEAKIDGIVITKPTGTQKIEKGETYKAVFYLKIEKGSRTPSNVKYSFNFDDGSANYNGSNPEPNDSICKDDKGCTIAEPIKHDYTKGGAYEVSVNIWNQVSRGYKSEVFNLYAVISGLEVTLEVCDKDGKCHPGSEEGTLFPDYEPLSFMASTKFGSLMEFTWKFGDSEQPVTTKEENITHRFTVDSHEEFTVTLTAKNVVSKESASKTITVMRAVGEASYILGNTAVKNFTTTVCLITDRNGFEPCYFFDFGDPSPIMTPRRYVLFGTAKECQRQHAALFKKESGLEVFPIETDEARQIKKVSDQRVDFNITFQTLGRLFFTFIGANKVSKHVSKKPLGIASGPCYLPLVSLGAKSTTLWKSREYVLYPSVYLNCSSTNIANYTFHIYKLASDRKTVVKEYKEKDFKPDVIQLNCNDGQPKIFSKNRFEYGVYKITLNVSMFGEIGLWSYDEMLLDVVPSPLTVDIAGGMLAIAKFGTNFTIAATNYSLIDPDVSISDQSKLRYIWMCKRYCETWPKYSDDYQHVIENSTNHCTPDEAQLAVLMTKYGCFAYSKKDVIMPGVLNTSLLMENGDPGTLMINGEQLREGENGTLNVKVVVYKDDGLGRSGWFEQELKVLQGDPPNIELICVTNCNDKYNPSNRFSLLSKIKNYILGMKYNYKWELKEVITEGAALKMIPVPLYKWQNEASTGTTSGNLALNASPYFKQFANDPSDKVFNFILRCRRVGTEDWGLSSYKFAVNRLPKTRSAKCRPHPAFGMAVRDKFNIICDGEFVDEDLPLTYKIAYRQRKFGEMIWVYQGGSPTVPDGALIPQGSEEDNYIVSMIIQAVDTVGGYSELDFPVWIIPPDEATIKSKLGDWTFVEQYLNTAIDNGNVASMCQMMALYGSYLNELRLNDLNKLEAPATTTGSSPQDANGSPTGTAGGTAATADSTQAKARRKRSTQGSGTQSVVQQSASGATSSSAKFTKDMLWRNTNERAQKRFDCITKFRKLQFKILGTLNQVIPALGVMTSVKEELTLETQDEVLRNCKYYVDVVKAAAGNGESADLIEDSVRGILSIIADVSSAAGENGTRANECLEALDAPEPTGSPALGQPTTEPPTIDPALGSIQDIRKNPVMLDEVRQKMQRYKDWVKEEVTLGTNLMGELYKTVQKNKVAGESPTILTTKSKNISCVKQFTENFAKEPISPGGASKISMPPAEGMFGPANESTPSVEAIASSQNGNPFTYGNSSNSNGTAPPAVTGNVVSFSIRNETGDPMLMTDLTEPFVMNIPQAKPEVETADNYTSTDKAFKKFHMVEINPTCTLAINVIDVNDTWGEEFEIGNDTDTGVDVDPSAEIDPVPGTAELAGKEGNETSKGNQPKPKKGVPVYMKTLQGVDDIKQEVRFIIYLKKGQMPSLDNYDFSCTLPHTPTDDELGLQVDSNSTLSVNSTATTTTTPTEMPFSTATSAEELLSNDTFGDNFTTDLPEPPENGKKKYPPPVRDLNTCHFDPKDMNISETTKIYIGVNAVPYNATAEDHNVTSFLDSKYRLAAYMVGCLYFDEDTEVWSTAGCWVGKKTTPELTECKCNHLTNFGSTFVVPMNPIDLGSPGFGNLNENPTVFATYVCSVIMYCVLLIWAIKADRIDEMKAGATPLPDNDPRDKYLYELLVTTRDQPNAGTTAQVSFILIGEDNETEPRVLMDERRKVLQKGDTDTFVLAVPAPLGNLSTLRIWHDDSGKSPGWFFFQMQVTDLQTKEKTFFICQRWLARNEDDSLIDRIIPAAGIEEMTDFNYLFWTKTTKDLTDGHIWFSIFKRPARSKFSRVQRLTCCLLLLYSSMLSSLMFFGSEPEFPKMLKIGPIKISFYTIQVGIYSGLVVVPVNILIVFLFRYSKDPPTGWLSAKKKQRGIAYNASDRTSLDSIEIELQKEKEYLDSGKRNLDMNHERGAGVTYIDNQNGVPRVAMAMKEQKPKKKKPFSLPWQTLFFAYFIVAVSCSTAFYFAVKFGQAMGFNKTVRWISSFSLGTLQSILLQDPVKIIILSAFYAIVLKKPDDGEDTELEPEDIALRDDEEYLHDHLTEKEAEMGAVREKIAQYKVLPEPPDEGMLKEVRQHRTMQNKLMMTIWGLMFYIVYLIFLSLVAADIRDNNSFAIYNNFKNIYDRDTFTLDKGIGSNVASSIRNHDNFWNWAIDTLVPGTYGQKWFKQDPWKEKYSHFLADRVNFRVGPVRIRQVRQAEEPCDERVVNYGIGSKCRFGYSLTSEDTGNYRRGWIPVNKSDPNDKPDEGWGFQGAIELRSAPKSGLITMYGGGGYVLYLGDTAEIAKSRLQEYRKKEWIDKKSRGVHIEFLAFNPSTKLYFCSETIIEFMETGAAVPYYEGHVLKLLSGNDPNAMGSMILLFVFFGFIVYFFVQELKKMKLLRKDYFMDFWNNYEFVIIVLSFFAILMSIGRFLIAYDIGETMKDRSKFINMAYVVLWDKTAAYLLAFISFMSVLKCLRLLRFNKDVAGLFAMMNYVAGPLADFMVVFTVIFTSFCMITFFVFNTHLEEYKTYIVTLETLLSMMLNKFDAKRLTETSPVLGSLIFFSFVLTINFLMINFMLAIIMEAFVMCSGEIAEQNASKDHEIVTFMIGSFKKAVGLDKSPPPFQQECRLRYIEGANNSTDVACDEMISKMDQFMERFEAYVSQQADNKEIMQELDAIQGNGAKAKKKKRAILTG